MKYIQPKEGPRAVGPYNLAIEHNGFVFTAGQIGKDPKTDVLLDGIEQQTEQVLKNIELILEAVDLSRNHIVKTTVFIVNMDDYAKMNKVYGNFFRDHFPARSTIQVVKLPAGALIEIEAIAAK